MRKYCLPARAASCQSSRMRARSSSLGESAIANVTVFFFSFIFFASPFNTEAGGTFVESTFSFCKLEEAPRELSITRVSCFSESNKKK
jgi:hypothetical protein